MISSSYPKTKLNKVNRYAPLATYDCKTVHSIVNNTPVVHVSFIVDGRPVVLPMLGSMGSFENQDAGLDAPLDLYIHGYITARLFNIAKDSTKNPKKNDAEDDDLDEELPGLPVCVCATLVDGYVLTASPYSHNFNYRSAIIHGKATIVDDLEEKEYGMKIITNGIIPNRWEDTIKPTEANYVSTCILKIRVEAASAKISVGNGSDDAETKTDEIQSKIWTGVIPMYQTLGTPIQASYNKVESLPKNIASLIKATNEESEKYSVDAAKCSRKK